MYFYVKHYMQTLQIALLLHLHIYVQSYCVKATVSGLHY